MQPWCVTFLPTDTLNQRLKKAAHVQPSPAQLRWMEREYIGFLHYSPNTFTNRQWGDGTETADCFRPDRQSPAQWVKVCKDAGMAHVIPTLKHHDGFCQWDTESTDFSIRHCSVPQDIAQAMRDACLREGLGLGVYLSPWDMHERGIGVWGTPAYQAVYMRQLEELMTRYGEIDELWLDGACGDMPIWKPIPTYDPEAWYDLMEKRQPLCVVRRYDPFCFATEPEWAALQRGQGELRWRGKEVRWVGNEDGVGRTDEWSVQPVFCRELGREATLNDLGEESYYSSSVGAVWYPNEVNTHLLNQWFWNEETSHVRSLDELIGIFYHSIGNNGTLLLNVSPDRHGVIGEDQVARLMEFKRFMDDTFGTDAAEGASAQASSARPDTPAANVLSADKALYWSPDEADWEIDRSTASLELRLPAARRFDNVLVQEHIRQGQRVAHWRASAWVDGGWQVIAEKKTIGYKTICRFPAVTSDRVRIDILRSWDTPLLSRVSLHLTQKPESKELAPRTVLDIPALDPAPDGLKGGLRYTVYQGGVQSAAEIGRDGRAAARQGVTEEISLAPCEQEQDYSLLLEGYLYVPYRHEAMFSVGSADGCILSLNGQRLILNDEPHAYAEKSAYAVLHEGYYHLRVQYTSFRNAGQLRVRWTNPAYELCPIEARSLWHAAE